MMEPAEIQDEEYEQILERVAAVDVAKATGMVCTRVPDDSRPGRRLSRVWEIPATTNAIIELGEYLAGLGIQKITLEATSDYWRPFYYLFEAAGLDVQLVRAQDVKQAPGRPKSDPLTELPGGVPQVSGRVGVLVATVADHDHRRRYAAGPVAAGDAAGRVA
jgi:hypothetical protein